MSYRRQNLLATAVEALAEYVLKEFEAVERAFNMQDFVQLKQRNSEPAKPRDGMVVYADGTNWNPGSGEGIYAYYGGVWNKL